MIKMREVSRDSLQEFQEYLGLDFTPAWAEVEDFRKLDPPIETLLVKWSGGHERECNLDLDTLCQSILYEDEVEKMKKFYVINSGHPNNPYWVCSTRKKNPSQVHLHLGRDILESKVSGLQFQTGTGWWPVEARDGYLVRAKNPKKALAKFSLSELAELKIGKGEKNGRI